MYRSTNRRESLAELEIWFRIVHITLDGPDGAPVAAYREQTVEIALGSKGAFENGNVGTLTRRVAAGQVVSAVPPPRGKPQNRPGSPRRPGWSSFREATDWQALLESGDAANQADIARREGISRARVTQVMGLLRLAPEIQEHILAMPEVVRRPAITERVLRPIAQIQNTGEQTDEYRKLLSLSTSWSSPSWPCLRTSRRR